MLYIFCLMYLVSVFIIFIELCPCVSSYEFFASFMHMVSCHMWVLYVNSYLFCTDMFFICVSVIQNTQLYHWLNSPFCIFLECGLGIYILFGCRYEAAALLKKACLKHLALGEVIQLSHTITDKMKWFVPHSFGWQPLSMNIIVADATPAAKGKP